MGASRIADREQSRRIMAETAGPIRAAHRRDDSQGILERGRPGKLGRAAVVDSENGHAADGGQGADDMVVRVEIAEGVAAAVAIQDAGRACRHAIRHRDLDGHEASVLTRRGDDLDTGDSIARFGDCGE